VLESGTFTLTRLVAFQFYGGGDVEDTPLPPDFCGGRVDHCGARDDVDDCSRSTARFTTPGGQPPPGTSEGVKVNARGINFNKHATGDNLFVMLP
jgi:hypothetical protein